MATLPYNTQDLLAQSQAMLDQTKAEGSKSFFGSSFDKGLNAAPKPGLVTSSQPVRQRQAAAQKELAASNLVADPMQPPQFITGTYQDAQNNLEQGMNALKLSYRADLAATNNAYKQLHQELQNNMNEQLQIAEVNAAALNPYSQAQGAQTADSFNGAIKAKYAEQARKLEAQADAARLQLAAGNNEAYVKLMREAQQATRDFQKNMFEWMQGEQDAKAKAMKAEQDRQQAAIGNFVNLLKTDLPSMEALDKMSDSQILSLPAAQAGLAAGYDANTVIQGIFDTAATQNTRRYKDDLEIQKTKLEMQNTRSIMDKRATDSAASSRIPTFQEYLQAAEELAQMTFSPEMQAELRGRYDMLFAKPAMSRSGGSDVLSPEEFDKALGA